LVSQQVYMSVSWLFGNLTCHHPLGFSWHLLVGNLVHQRFVCPWIGVPAASWSSGSWHVSELSRYHRNRLPTRQRTFSRYYLLRHTVDLLRAV